MVVFLPAKEETWKLATEREHNDRDSRRRNRGNSHVRFALLFVGKAEGA